MKAYIARVDFTYGGRPFRKGQLVPLAFVVQLLRFGSMYVIEAP